MLMWQALRYISAGVAPELDRTGNNLAFAAITVLLFCCVLQASKPQLRRWIDTVGEIYSKVVIAATVAALIGLPMCGVPMLRYLQPCLATGCCCVMLA